MQKENKVIVKLNCFPGPCRMGENRVSRFFVSDRRSSVRSKIGRCRITTFRQNTDFNVWLTPDLHAKHHGFTLIELLVVVLIIGILAAVAVPQYQKAVIKAKLTRIDTMMHALFTGLDTYVLTNGRPTYEHIDLDQLDVGMKFDSYNSGEHSYYNEYGQWQIIISSFSSVVYFFGRDSMDKINIGIERRSPAMDPTQSLHLSAVPSELTRRKIVCQWWADRYGANTIVNGGNPSYPAKTWCAEVGVQ